jgi:hypothetical protein
MVVEILPPDRCVHCGRKTGDFSGGFASDESGLPLCHPHAAGRPDCYHLVTVYHHPVANCARCRQEPWEPLTSAEKHDAMMGALQRLEAMIQDVSP